MTATSLAARHRSAAKTSTPITDITETFVSVSFARKGAAAASVTGLALTATVAGTAFAEPIPTTVPSAPSNDFVSNLAAENSATLVSLDMDWEPGDEVAAMAAEPEPEPEPEPERVVTEAATNEVASRTYDRATETYTEDYSETVASAPAASTSGIASTALQYVGYPYVYGAAGPSAFDCSGFVQYIYGLHGISLPRTASAQGAAGTWIPASEAQPGDIVAWSDGSHVGIYLGNGQIVHASTPSTGVKTGSLWGSYYFVRV